MKSIVALRLVLASLIFASSVSAFATNVTAVRSLEPIAKSKSGQTVIRADGSLYIQLLPSEAHKLTAQELYQEYRAKFRELMKSDQTPDDDGYYVAADSSGVFAKDSFYGFALPSGKIVRGLKFTPSRQERLTNSSAESYIISETAQRQGAVLTGGCSNPQGTPEVTGVNFGRSGCDVGIKIFRKL